MKKLHRGLLLLSTCLSTALPALAPRAFAQSSDPVWTPRAEVDAETGKNRSSVGMELFAPVAQNDSNLLFIAGRVGYDERNDRNGSVTIGGRGRIGEDVAIGVHAGADFYRSDRSNHGQTAVTFGLEGFTSVFDLRLNYRLPTSGHRTLAFQDPNAAPTGVLLVDQNRLIERRSGFRLEEIPLAGFNGEVGARLPLAERFSVRLSAGGFAYRDDDAEQGYRGVRGGLDLDLDDPLGAGSRFSIGARVEDDNRFGTTARATARLSIAFGGGARTRNAPLTGLERQMGDRVRRDTVALVGTRRTDLTTSTAAIDPRTGKAFGGVYYAGGAATAPGRAGSSSDPTTLNDAVARAGQNGIVIALGAGGPISTGGVTLASDQYLIGGGSSVVVRRTNGSLASFTFDGTQGIVTGTNAGGATISLGQGSILRDITVRGAGTGVAATGVGGFALDRVVVENTGGTGLALTNTLGTVAIDGLTVRNAAGTGVVINGGSAVALRNATIGGRTGAIDVLAGSGALSISLANLTLSAAAGNVLDIDGTTGSGPLSVAQLSGLSILGGNGETGGVAIRRATFNSGGAGGLQPVNAGAMAIGSTAARVGGTGLSLVDVAGTLGFQSLDIATRDGTALAVRNAKTSDFTLTTRDGRIDAQGGTALDLDPLAIDLNFTSVRSNGAAGAGIVLDQVRGTGAGGNALTIGTVDIANSGAQGLLLTGGSQGQVTIARGTIADAGQTAVQIGEAATPDNGGTIGLDLGAAITGNRGAPLIGIAGAGGTIRFIGAISGNGGIAITGTRAGGLVRFVGPVAITGGGGIGSASLAVDNLAGALAFDGPLSVDAPLGDAIRIGNVPGGVSFGAVRITGLGAATGLDLGRAQGNVTFASLDLSGTGAAGSRGISLAGSTNTGAIVIGGASTIAGVTTGIDLSNATASGSFRFGDGSGADGLQATIKADVPILATGLDSTRGRYDLGDVRLIGDTTNLTGGSFTAYYVLAGAQGSGRDGADAGSLAGALASGAQYIVLLNDPTGGRDVFDVAGIGGTLTLGINQRLVSFLYSDFFAVTGATVPANLIVSDIGPTGITNPFAGSGSALLTSTSGSSAVVTLADGSGVDGVLIDGGTGVGVAGTGVRGATIANSNISGGNGAVVVSDGGKTASVTLRNLDLSASGGTALNLDGSGGGTLTVDAAGVGVQASGSGAALALTNVTSAGIALGTVTGGDAAGNAVSIRNVTGADVTLGDVTTSGNGSSVLIAGNDANVRAGALSLGTTALTGVTIAGNRGSVTLGDLTLTRAGGDGVAITANTGTVALGNVTLGTVTGSGVAIDGNRAAVTLGNVTLAGAGGDGVAVTDQRGNATIGRLDLTGAGARGLTIGPLGAGSVTVGGGMIRNPGTTGVSIGGIANGAGVTVGALSVLGGDTAVALGNVAGSVRFTGTTSLSAQRVSGIALGAGTSGSIAFGDVVIAGLAVNGRGIDARTVTGTVNLASLDLSAASAAGTRGIDLSGNSSAATLWIDGGSIRGVETGIDLSNAAMTGSFRFGDGSNTDADGAAASIDAMTPVAITGLSGATGRYDLADVRLSGDTGALVSSARLYWVQAGANGTGSRNDPGSLAGASVSGADIIVLVNDPSGGTDTLDANDATTGSGGTLVLGAGQQLVSFGAADTLAVPGGAPANLTLFGITRGSIANPFAGSGAPVLTTSAANRATVLLATNALLDGLVIANGGNGAGVATPGSVNVTNVVLRNSRISGGSAAVALASGSNNVSAALSNLTLASRGTGLAVDGSGSGSLTLSSLANITILGGQGESAGAVFTRVRFDADPLTAGDQAVAATLTIGSAGARLNGAGLVLDGTTGALTLNDTSIVNHGGPGLLAQSTDLNLIARGGSIDTIDGGALMVTLGGVDLSFDAITHSGSGAAVLVTSAHGTGPGRRLLDVARLIANGGGGGIVLSDSTDGSFHFGAASSITDVAGPAINIIQGTGQIDLDYDGSIRQTGGALLEVDGHHGTLRFGSTSSLIAPNGFGLSFRNADGDYEFNGITDLGGGARLLIGQGSSGSFTFGTGARITGNGIAPAIELRNNSAGLSFAGTLGQAGGAALSVTSHSAGTLDFTGATFAITGGDGFAFDNADGDYRFGTLTLAGGARIAVTNGSAGNFAFGALTLRDLAAGKTGIDLTGATGNVAIATLDLGAASAIGTRGIDLSGSHSAAAITIGGNSRISGTGIGVDLTNAALTGSFRFGDGSNTDANGASSTITAATPLVITGLNGAAGLYNFADVNLVGDTSTLAVPAYYVAAGGTGTGTRSDPGSLASALAANAVNIVLINDPTGGTDIFDMGTGTLQLAGGQSLYSFRDGDSFSIGGGAPANVTLYNVQTGLITNPFAGSGAPIVTGNGAATITLGGSNLLDGLVIANTGNGAGVLGTCINGVSIIRNSTISGGLVDGAINLTAGAGAARYALANLVLSSRGGTVLSVDGGATNAITLSSLTRLTLRHDGESAGIAIRRAVLDANPGGADGHGVDARNLVLGTAASNLQGDALSLDTVTGTLDIGGIALNSSGGIGIRVSGTTRNGFTLAGDGGTITTDLAAPLSLSPLTLAWTLDRVTATNTRGGFSIADAAGSLTVRDAVSITGANTPAFDLGGTGGPANPLIARFLGAVNIGVSSGSGTGVQLRGSSGTRFEFAGGLTVNTVTGTALAATGGELAITGGALTTTGGAALSLSGVTIGSTGLRLDSIDTTGTGNAILLDTVDGAPGATLSLGQVRLRNVAGTSTAMAIVNRLGVATALDQLEIGLASSTATALSFNGATLAADFRAGTFVVTNSAAAGMSTGVNLNTAGGGKALRLGNAGGASITGVGTGVTIDAGTDLDFTYGDGDATVFNSTLSALTPINVITAPTTGRYDFRDVTFAGGPGLGFGIGRVRFIDADGATGGGNGTGIDGANPMTLTDAEAQQMPNDIFLLVNNGNAISVAGSNGDNSFVLRPGSSVYGFGTADGKVTLALTVPSTFLLSSNTLTISNPGNGAATLTGPAGATIVTLQGGASTLAGFTIDGSGNAANGVVYAGGGASGMALRELTLRNLAGNGVQLANVSNAVLERLTFIGDSTLRMDGGADNVLRNISLTGTSNGVRLTGLSGITTLTNLSVNGAFSGLALANMAGTVNATGVTLASIVDDALVVNGGTASIGFDATSSIAGAGNWAVQVLNGHSGTLTYAGTVTAGATAGMLFNGAQGNYSFTGTNSLQGSGAQLQFATAAGTYNFGPAFSLVRTGAGDAFLVNGSTASITYGGSITADQGRAVSISGINGGTVTFQTGRIHSVGIGATGILVQNSQNGTVRFNGPVELGTAGQNALTLLNNLASTSVIFDTGTAGLSITTGAGTGVTMEDAGSLSILGTNNRIVTGSGAILNISNGAAGAAALDVHLADATMTGGSNGLSFVAAGTGAITGTVAIDGGSITANNAGVRLTGDGLTFNYGGTITASGAGARAVDASARTGGIATFGGAIVDTGLGIRIANNRGGGLSFTGTINAGVSGATAPLSITGNSGGTYSFSGATKLFNTGTQAAVTLSGNSGATVLFQNGGLAITTSSGAGFSATGGGTISVTGTGNVINSGTGTALTVTSTTLGLAGLEFRSISANGAANGVLLSNTGSFGGLTVTGTGTAGSGGTIRNSTGDGISLTNTQNVRLTGMTITGNLGNGIGGSGVTGFVLDGASITGNGNDAATQESGINLTNLSGSAANGARPTGIYNSTIANNNLYEVQISNTGGTLVDFQVVNSTFRSDGAAVNGNAAGQHGNLFNFFGNGSSTMAINVTGSNFIGNWDAATPPAVVTGTGLSVNAAGTAMTANVSGSTFTANNVGVSITSDAGSSSLNFVVDSNNISGQRSTAINTLNNGNSPFNRTVSGRISNNSIGIGAVSNSGSLLGNGISIANEGAINATYSVIGNTIRQVAAAPAIAVNVGLGGGATGGGTTNLTIQNNVISDIGSRAITVQDNQVDGPAYPTIRLNLTGNSFTNIAGQAGNGQYLRLRSLNGSILVTQLLASGSGNAAELDDANGFNDPTKISVSGTILYGQSQPPLP